MPSKTATEHPLEKRTQDKTCEADRKMEQTNDLKKKRKTRRTNALGHFFLRTEQGREKSERHIGQRLHRAAGGWVGKLLQNSLLEKKKRESSSPFPKI